MGRWQWGEIIRHFSHCLSIIPAAEGVGLDVAAAEIGPTRELVPEIDIRSGVEVRLINGRRRGLIKRELRHGRRL